MAVPHAPVIDSLHHVIAQKDSVIAVALGRLDSLMGAAPDTIVRVAAPADMLRGPWCETGLAQTLMGGGLAILAGFGAQWFRGVLENRKTKTQLISRIRSVLEAVRATARSTLKKDETRAINPETMQGILIEWDRYDRLSDNLGLLGDPKLEEKIDAVLGFMRMGAEKVSEDERRFRETRREVGTPGPKGLQIDPEIEEDIQKKRKLLLTIVRKMGDHAQELLDGINAKWPPSSWHEERRLAEDGKKGAAHPPDQRADTPAS